MHQGCLYKVVTVVMNTFPPTPVWSQHYQRYINTQQWRSNPCIPAVVGLINRLQIRAEYDTTLGVYPSRRSGSLAGSERLQWLCPPGLPSTSITTLSKCLLIRFDRAPAAAEMDECVTSYLILSNCKNVTQSSALSQRNVHVWLQDSLSGVCATETDSWDDFI